MSYFDRVLAAPTPLVFLTMMPGANDGKVVRTHCAGKYTTPPLGGYDLLSRTILGMVGDVALGQLPTPFTLACHAGAHSGVHSAVLKALQLQVASIPTMILFYSVAGNDSKTLASTAVLPPPAAGVGPPPSTHVEIPNMMLVPLAWAPYFMEPNSPIGTWVLVEQVAMCLSPVAQAQASLVKN